jgi:hypothetical protein
MIRVALRGASANPELVPISRRALPLMCGTGRSNSLERGGRPRPLGPLGGKVFRLLQEREGEEAYTYEWTTISAGTSGIDRVWPPVHEGYS